MTENEPALYRQWLDNADGELRQAILSLSEEEAAETFADPISFGTGGIRRKEGVGPGRINDVTVAWAAAALAETLRREPEAIRSGGGKEVLIFRDTRQNSLRYARLTAAVLKEKRIPAVLLDTPAPVPMLSFALKSGGYRCGVMITASHNPAAYNGMKLYNGLGGQLTPAATAAVERRLKAVSPFDLLKNARERMIKPRFCRADGDRLRRAYLDAVTSLPEDGITLKAAATPLYGAAGTLLREALSRRGHTVFTVPEQERPDPLFGGVAAPNPEDPAVFDLIRPVGEANGADLLLAVDGDGDRCGCFVREGERYTALSGNDIAAVLLHHLCETVPIPDRGYIVRTAVSGGLGEKVAAAYGLRAFVTPTGFKYIGEALADDDNGVFFAGYEESGGFLWGSHAADKDGIAAAVLLCAAAARQKRAGKTLLSDLRELRTACGEETARTERFAFPGLSGRRRMEACLSYFKTNPFPDGDLSVRGDTLTFRFPGERKAALRPSGTEPYLKLYCFAAAPGGAETLPNRFRPVIESFRR